MHLIGHSLGAHTAAEAGRRLGGHVGRLTGRCADRAAAGAQPRGWAVEGRSVHLPRPRAPLLVLLELILGDAGDFKT